jgi:leader peptidase (prepilin peptidase) / N-methyltransferase
MVTTLVIGGAILGLLIGSFINVVAYRIPNGISVITPPSACPACAHEIRPRDNVPVLGWLLLRGRCRDCAEPISVRYPIVEAATAVLFALTPLVVGAVWVVPAYWWFVGVTVTLVLTDLDYTRIPNRILYPGTIVATVLLAIGAGLDDAWSAFGRAVAGGVCYFVVLLAIALIARGGFGFGDVKLALLLGEFLAFRSWDSLFVGVFAAFVVGGLASVVLLALRSVGRKDAIAFGPAMVAGAYIGISAGVAIVDWYLG